MIPLGAIINALGITIGSLVGLAFGARLPERVRAIVFQGLGLCVLVIGFKWPCSRKIPSSSFSVSSSARSPAK